MSEWRNRPPLRPSRGDGSESNSPLCATASPIPHSHSSSTGEDAFADLLHRFDSEMRDMVERIADPCDATRREKSEPRVPPPGSFSAPGNVSGTLFGKERVCQTRCVRDVALRVWAALGFFAPPPLRHEETEQTREGMRGKETAASHERGLDEDGAGKEEERSHDTRNEKEDEEEDEVDESVCAFVAALERYYQQETSRSESAHVHTSPSSSSEVSLVDDEVLARGLWLVLFNAVFYCVTALDTESHGRLRDLFDLSNGTEEPDACVDAACEGAANADGDLRNAAIHTTKERNPTDHYRHSSPSSRDAMMHRGSLEEGSMNDARGHVKGPSSVFPSRLQWLSTSLEPKDKAMAEGRQGQRRNGRLLLPESDSTRSTARRAKWIAKLRHCENFFGGRLDALLPITAWHFILHTLAHLGYTRDVFYVQTPFHASVHELLLVLLWLTKTYQLVAVAEYVRLERNYPFLLGHRDSQVAAKDASGAMLLRQFPSPVPWPPASFEEASHMACRVSQLQRLLPEPDSASPQSASATCERDVVRRLLSAQRLTSLSLRRLESALLQRAEQTASLGLHAALDAQLCLREHHTPYVRLCRGLQHLCGMEERVPSMLRQLSVLAQVVAAALQRAEHTPEEIRRRADTETAAREDAAIHQRTPNPNPNPNPTRSEAHAEAEPDKDHPPRRWRLREALVRFRAARTREQLADLWGTIRRSAVIHQTAPSKPDARAELETRVAHNMSTRYALHSAMRSELHEWHRHAPRRGFPDMNGPSRTRRVVVAFPLVTQRIALRSQATAVGEPAHGATTSARVELERIEAAMDAMRQQPEPRAKHAQEQQEREAAIKWLGEVHGLRVVPRKT